MFKEIVLKCFRDYKQLVGVNDRFQENFADSPWVTRQLFRQPRVAASLPVQFGTYKFSYLGIFVHFDSDKPRPICQQSKKKSVCRPYDCLFRLEGSGKTVGDNKHETAHALKREPFAIFFHLINFPDFSKRRTKA